MSALASPLPSATYRNLSAWFLAKPARESVPDYAVLGDALANATALLHETGNVNELSIENPSDTDVFIQAGDIVKGGRQDRTLGADFIVPAHSGRIPVPAFCVESARWHQRRHESAAHFSSSDEFVSSKKTKAAFRTSRSQREVWSHVAEAQTKLSAHLGVDCRSAESPSSLLHTFERPELRSAHGDYLETFSTAPEENTTGVVWTINGIPSHADLYASPALFRKVWPKLLRSSALEAMTEFHPDDASLSIGEEELLAWLDTAIEAPAEEETLPPRTRILTRRAHRQLRSETLDTSLAAPVHVSILALG